MLVPDDPKWSGDRRLVLVRLPLWAADALCKPTKAGVWVRTSRGVPADAELVRAAIDPLRDEVVLTYRHPSFAVVHPGCQIPSHPGPEMTELHAATE